MSAPGHTLQSTPGSCIAACVSMVLTQAGQDTSEAELMRLWRSAPPYDMGHIARHLRPHRYVSSDPVSVEVLRARLEHRWALIVVYGGPMTVFAHEHTPSLRSPYGPLVTLYTERGALMNEGWPNHAVVVVGITAAGVRVLGPCRLGDHQPLDVSWAWLDALLAGSFWFA